MSNETSLHNFNNSEKILFSIGNNFNLKVQSNFGTKGVNDTKRDPIYIKGYRSNKFSDVEWLKSMTISTSDFLVFSYSSYDKEVGYDNADVFVSYPHMVLLIAWLRDTLTDLYTNQKNYFTSSGLTDEGKEKLYRSEKFGGGKNLAIIPWKNSITIGDQEILEDGVAILIDENNENEHWVTTTLDNFATMVELIENFNLGSFSMMLTMSTQIQELKELVLQLIEGNGPSNYRNSSPSMNRTGSTPSRNGIKRGLQPRMNKSTPSLEGINDDEDEEDETVGEKPASRGLNRPVKKNPPKPVQNKNHSKEDSLEDLDDIMNNNSEEEDPIIGIDDIKDMATDFSDLDTDFLDEDDE